MRVDKYLTYRGAIKAVVGVGDTLLLVTVHPEGQPTPVYWVDTDKFALAGGPLPAGGVRLVVGGDTLWVGGSDRHIYRAPVRGGPPTAVGPQLTQAPAALTLLSEERLAVAAGTDLTILARKDGKVLQTLPLPEPGTALAADATGRWLVAGTNRGTVAVFDGEDKAEFLPAESARLHEGAVTALLFEREELRFFSAGADQKLLSTHARGKLEPEDKGRGNNHTEPVTAMLWAAGDRFLTGSRDGTVKTWPRVGNVKPATLKDGVGKVVDLALVEFQKKPHLAVACEDNTIRLFQLDEEGKFGEWTHTLHGALAWAKHEFAEPDATRREQALKALAESNDTASIELLSEQVGKDVDHTLRLLGAQLLGQVTNPRAARLLEDWLKHPDEAVCVAALHGLRRHLGQDHLRPLELALKVEKVRVGEAAVEGLQGLAAQDDQALARLTEALDHKVPQVRLAALAAMEKVYGADSPEANLLALNSRHADVRRVTLVRLFQRQMARRPRVQAALRWRLEDQDADVRKTAYLVSLYTRPRLVAALRSCDRELRRQLTELETTGQTPATQAGTIPGDELERKLDLPIAELGLSNEISVVLKDDGATRIRDLAVRTDEELLDSGFLEEHVQEVEKKLAALGLRLGGPPFAVVAPQPEAPPAEPPVRVRGKVELAEGDYDPLLQATASRALDTCLMGARGLAVLRDPRAFGLLLQLSREQAAWARVEVCRALAALDDPRSLKRLRTLLHDAEASVRDAAFTALAHIHTDEPLLAAESGLNAGYEDVRRRGLQLLITEVRKAPPTKADQPAWQLLVRALNDSFPGVRGEAFKAALNLKIAGGGIHTLRFVLQSVHADVRREVLTEVMAQASEEWAWNLLLEFYNDHDPKLREDAFNFAVNKTKELGPLEAALASQYADVRRRGVEGLIKKHTKPAQALLVHALADKETMVRQPAVDALVDEDARQPLAEALKGPHPDVVVRAAGALAAHGDREVLKPLLALATAPEPQQPERQPEWLALAERAVSGLARLGDPAALTDLLPLLDSRHASLRKAAAEALVWVSRPGSLEALRQALQHADAEVKYHAALGLAYAGDPLGASLVFSDQARAVLKPEEQLVGALTLGPAGEDQLVVFLDDADEQIRNQALLLLMMLELKTHAGTPARSLACLSSRMPRVRLTAARALECFADLPAFLLFVVQLFNDRGDEQPWKVPQEIVEAVADLIAFASPHTRARTAIQLRHLSAKEQAAWNQPWALHQARFASELEEVRAQAAERGAMPVRTTPEQLRQLAFGAYVGLVREHGGAPAQQVARVRQTALARIFALAQTDAAFAKAAQPVFIQALGDPNQPVRLQAFEHLLALGTDRTTLGAEALEAGHTDLGIKGLELLAGSAAAGEGDAVLERVLLARTDNLAVEAAKLLIARRGPVPVASKALEAAFENLRGQAVDWLAAEYDKDEAAKEQLRHALASRYWKVRHRAALELATKKDAAAFEALVRMLASADDAGLQLRVIEALRMLGDPRSPDAFMDRVETDPRGTAQAGQLLSAAGGFRRPESADRLLGLMEKNLKWREPAFNAELAISGYDQAINDPEDENPDRTWETKQHPRHDAVLTRLMERCLTLGDPKLLMRLIPGARWARGKEVDPGLAALANHPQDNLRQSAVEALGWRLRKRQGAADALLRTVQHREPVTQFLAAEGLARAGRAEGLNVLLASVEFMSDLRFRKRAVKALGELRDVRALDTLLRLANEDGHALQEEAAEALGHLGKSDKAEEIFKLLERFARGQGGVAANALRGLRWLNTHAGWQLIRARALDPGFWQRVVAVQLLGEHDDPATRELLLRLLAEDVNAVVVSAARTAARKLWGAEALDPDYALLQNRSPQVNAVEMQDALKRVCERGDARRIFEILPKCPPQTQEALAISLLNRVPAPLAEAQGALGSPEEATARLAAHLIGRAGASASAAGKPLQEALEKWLKVWDERRQKMLQENRRDDPHLTRVTPCVRTLIWAAGRLGVAQPTLLSAAAARPDDTQYRSIRQGAVAALASGKLTDAVAKLLESVATGNDPELRTLAADALGREKPAVAAKLAPALLSDRVSFDRLARGDGTKVEETARSAAGQVHYQGVALPHLIMRGDVVALAAVAEDRKLPDATRLGAIEGLARLARENAEVRLVQIGKAEKEDEELRKAAWRGLRRSKRARMKQAQAPAAPRGSKGDAR
jgi:ParB family chromosome partitioning protein